jgi:hypothetical protein
MAPVGAQSERLPKMNLASKSTNAHAAIARGIGVNRPSPRRCGAVYTSRRDGNVFCDTSAEVFYMEIYSLICPEGLVRDRAIDR